MSQQFDQKQDSKFRAFLPFLSIMMGAMLFIGVGVSMGQQKEKDLQNMQPDVSKSFTDCRVLDKQAIRIRAVTTNYASTSCGYFSISKTMASTMEMGGTYNLVVTYRQGEHKGYGYIRELTTAAS